MKSLNELIEDVLDVEAKARAADHPFTDDYGADCEDMFKAGARATGEPLAKALKVAIRQRDEWMDPRYRDSEEIKEDDDEIRAILEAAK